MEILQTVTNIVRRLGKPRIVKLIAAILLLCFLLWFYILLAQLRVWNLREQSLVEPVSQLRGDNSDERFHNFVSNRLMQYSIKANGSTETFQRESKKQGHDKVKDKPVNECNYPILDPFDRTVMALSIFNPPISCEKGVPHLVYLSGNTIKVNHSRTALFGNDTNKFKECRYKSVDREPDSDFKTVVLYTSKSFNYEIDVRDVDDHVIVECFDINKNVISRSYFTFVHVKNDLELELQEKYKKHLTLNSPKEVLNVFMIGMDGNSKQNFERHMPKTRNFLLHELRALELHKYNEVGGHTYSNLCPLLTGKLWNELHRDKWTFHEFFDYINEDFLWNEFRQVGYRTGAFFDENFLTAFHFYKKGWNKAPVDYYMRAALLERNNDTLMKGENKYCVGDIPEIALNNDFYIQMATKFNNSKTRPYFVFSFSTSLTHDDHNMASAGDNLYLQFFQELKDKNLIDNTVIVFYSDHGARFGNVRGTYNGMLESRMPYIFLVFPPWFYGKYPELMKVLKINQEQLTTNKDVHATIRDLVKFTARTGKGDINSTGISLFYEIPRERSCLTAGIPMELCVCHEMTELNISRSMNLLLAESILNTLHSLTDRLREKCEKLELQSTKSVMRVKPGSMTKEEEKEYVIYQMTIITTPGGALYEAKIKYNFDKMRAKVIGDIMRLNMYRGQAECIDDPKLRPFCYCKT